MNGRAQRAFPRVQHRTTLRVVREEPGSTDPVADAETVNLGVGGLAFESATSFHPQEPIECVLTIGGRPAQLPGTVAWSASLPGGRQRYGVAFAPLPEGKREVLYQAVTAARAGGKPITLRFVDMNRRVDARAVADTGGLRIRAPFPMLTAGTRVLLEEASTEAAAAGQITAVELDRSGPIPVLEFLVALDSWPGQAKAREQEDDHGDTGPAPSHPPIPEAELPLGEPPAAARRASPPPLAKTSPPSTDPSAVGQPPPLKLDPGAAGSTAPTLGLQPEPEPERAPDEEAPEAAAPLTGSSSAPQPPHQLSGHGLRARMLSLIILLGLAVVAVVLAFGPLRRQLSVPARSEAASTAPPTDDASPASPEAEHTAESTLETTAAPDESLEEVAEERAAEPVVEPMLAPKVVVEGKATLIHVPVTGRADGMVVQLWKQPPGIALQLPNATVTLPARRYPITRGRVSYVRIGEPGQRTSFKAVVTQPVRAHDVQLQGGTLTVRLDF